MSFVRWSCLLLVGCGSDVIRLPDDPPVECFGLDEAACEAQPACDARSGLLCDGSGEFRYVGCTNVDASCGDADAQCQPIGEPDGCVSLGLTCPFPDSCPEGWEPCPIFCGE